VASRDQIVSRRRAYSRSEVIHRAGDENPRKKKESEPVYYRDPKKVALDPDLVSNGSISQEMPELSTDRTPLFAIFAISLLEYFFASSS
jgi:hypothetical protein